MSWLRLRVATCLNLKEKVLNNIEHLWANLPWSDYAGSVFATIIPYDHRGFLGFATENSQWDFGLHMQAVSPDTKLDAIIGSFFEESRRGQCFKPDYGSVDLDMALMTGQAHILIYYPTSAKGKVEWGGDSLMVQGYAHDHPAREKISPRSLSGSQ